MGKNAQKLAFKRAEKRKEEELQDQVTEDNPTIISWQI